MFVSMYQNTRNHISEDHNNNDILRSNYFAYFHSIASYEIILWGNSSYSRKIFTLQKRIIRTSRTACRELSKKLAI